MLTWLITSRLAGTLGRPYRSTRQELSTTWSALVTLPGGLHPQKPPRTASPFAARLADPSGADRPIALDLGCDAVFRPHEPARGQ